MTFAEIFDLWSGPTELARDMGVKTTTADQWRRRNFLHPRWWPRLIEVVEHRHQRIITPRQLMQAACESRGRSQDSARQSSDAEAA